MKNAFKVGLLSLTTSLILSGCSLDGDDGADGTNGTNGSDGLNSLILQTAIDTGTQCTFGGVQIDSGLDDNADGTLDASEIDATEYVCENGYWLQLLHFADVDGNESTALAAVDEFSAMVNGVRNDAQYGSNTLLVSSGDNVIAGPRWFAAEDSSVRSLTGSNEPGHVDHYWMNEFGVVASALGNHELDQGPGELADAIVSESSGGVTFPGAQFPYLAANVDFSGEGDFTVATDGENARTMTNGQVAGSAIVRVGSEYIGLVGASTPDLPSITSTGDLVISGSTETISELAAAIQPAIDALTETGIDKIIVLAHMQQISIEKALAELLTDVDIIVAGGSNTRMGDATDTLFPGDTAFAETYPYATTDADGNPTLVVNVDGDYKYLGRLVVGFDDAGLVIPGSIDETVSGAWASTAENVALVGGTASDNVVATRDAIDDVIQAQFSNIVGHTDVFLEGRRGVVRTEETNLGNLTSDSMIAYAENCTELTNVLALKNGGGIRAEIGNAVTTGTTTELFPPFNDGVEGAEAGDVSEGHFRGTLRFDNGLVVLDVTGDELKMLLEHGVSETEAGATPGKFPQVGGISFGFDPSLTAGARITDLWVDTDTDMIPDTALYTAGVAQAAAADTYQLVTLNFLANGGDDYPFADLAAPNRHNIYSGTGFGETIDYPDLTSCDFGMQSDFSYTGGEQDALAEYFMMNHPDASMAYDVAETAPADDRRIQDLSVIGAFVAP